jgi:hypothetical protein
LSSTSPTTIQRSIMAPNANVLTAPTPNSTEQHHRDHMPTIPVISALSPAFTFTASRHSSFLRNSPGPVDSNNTNLQAGSGRRSSAPVSNSDPASTNSNSNLSTPVIQSVSQIDASNSDSLSTPAVGSDSDSHSEFAAAEQHPVLNRLRSEGPPPYIPMPPEAALPCLPPEYDTAVTLVNPSNAASEST